MCILCVIQKWSRRVATMLPWLVIPLIGLWALSQLLPPAFRFEITSPRLACVFVLLVTLFWYEILMPQLSAWRVRRNARLRERKRFEAIEMQKLRKTATRRCRNCLTPYRDQNPGGGKFMCSYCGHISKRPVLDLPVPPGLGLPSSGILRDLVGKGGKIFNGRVWSDNAWTCGQDWLENGNVVGGSFSGKSSHWEKNGVGFFGSDGHCLTEKSYSHVIIFSGKVLRVFFFGIMWLWRKIFRVSSSIDDASMDAAHRRMLAKRGEMGANCQESRGEKARRKAEEKKQARLEKELLEEEERKQREEVARLVEERRRLRDEKMEAEKERTKDSPSAREKDHRKEREKRRQERKKEKDVGSSKSNSDVEELERRSGKESERNRKNDTERREHHRTGPDNFKVHGAEMAHAFRGASTSNHSRTNVGTRYLDRMRGTFLSSSKAFTGGGFFGRGSNTSAAASREYKSINSVDHGHSAINRRELSQPLPGKININGDNVNRPVFIEQQPCTAPKKSWHQLFTRSSDVSPPYYSNVIGRPSGKPQTEVQSPPFSGHQQGIQSFDNPISFGLPSPFALPTFPYGPTSTSTSLPLSTGLPAVSGAVFPGIGEAPRDLLPEDDIFEDPCYVPDPIALLGPVSESLDNFQLDLGFVTTDKGTEKPRALKNIVTSSEVNKPLPIESPMSRLRGYDERNQNSFFSPSTPKGQEKANVLKDDQSNGNEKIWQMWNSSPLGEDLHPLPQKTMASLFKNDDQHFPVPHSQNVFPGAGHGGGAFGNDPWSGKPLFGPTSGGEDHFAVPPMGGTTQSEMIYGSPSHSAANLPFELPPASTWANRKEQKGQGSGEGIGNSPIMRAPIGGLYSSAGVQSLWSYD